MQCLIAPTTDVPVSQVRKSTWIANFSTVSGDARLWYAIFFHYLVNPPISSEDDIG